MNKVLNRKTKAGSKRKSEPRHIGDIINEMLLSNEPLAEALLDWIAEREKTRAAEEQSKANRLFVDIYPHTELCVDLKLLTLEPGRMDIGAIIHGILTRDGEEHYSFLEDGDQKNASTTQRNPHVYRGRFVNVNQSSDGTMYPTFNRPRYSKEFTFQDLCREAAAELLMVAGPVEKKGSKKRSNLK